MKKKYFYLSVLCLLGFCFLNMLMAQGQDANHEWIGNSVSTVADETDEDMGTVYLYNVGTGEYLNTGSYWGTVVVGFNVGMTVHIQKSSSTYYRMTGPLVTTEGKNIAFGRRMDTPGYNDKINYNHVYVDRGVKIPLRILLIKMVFWIGHLKRHLRVARPTISHSIIARRLKEWVEPVI